MIRNNPLYQNPYFIVLFLLTLNLVLKFLFIGDQSVTDDEPFSIYHALHEPGEILSMMSHYNNPPLHELILHYWIKVFGWGAVSVRTLPAIFSSLTAVFIFLLGKKHFNTKVGILGAFIFSLANYHMDFAHEARVYALFVLLSTVSMFLFLDFINRPKNKALILWMVLVNSSLIYSHYFGFFILLIQALIVCSLLWKNREILLPYFISGLLIVLFYAPHLVILLERFGDSAERGTWVVHGGGVEIFYNMIWAFCNKPFVAAISIIILIAALTKALVNRKTISSKKERVYIIFWFVFPLFFMYFVSFWVPMYISKYLAFLTPAFYLSLAAAAYYLFKHRIGQWILPGILLLGFAFTFNPNVPRRYSRSAIEKTLALKKEGSLIILAPVFFSPNFTYYYDPQTFEKTDGRIDFQLMSEELNKQGVYPIYSIDKIEEKLRKTEHVIFFDAAVDFSYPNNGIRAFLDKHFDKQSSQQYSKMYEVTEYRKQLNSSGFFLKE